MRAAVAALIVTLGYAAVARAQQQGCPQVPCFIRDAACVDGFCRLGVSEPLIPNLSLSTIAVQQPGPRAITTSQPDITFTFPAGAATVNVIIANDRPYYDTDAQLANPDAVVWFWSSAWQKLTTGVVSYASGHLVKISDNTCTLQPIAPLAAGSYFLSVLGLDAQGKPTSASEILPIAVTQESTSLHFCSRTDDCNPVGGDFVCMLPDHFCVIRCASERDCFTNEICDTTTASRPDFPWGFCRPPGPGCPCPSDQLCEDAMNVCYTPKTAHLGGDGGCDCGGSDNSMPNPCYSASASALLGCVFIRRRPRRPGPGSRR
jgi:hypothetical protein